MTEEAEDPALKKWQEGRRQEHIRLAQRTTIYPRSLRQLKVWMKFIQFDGTPSELVKFRQEHLASQNEEDHTWEERKLHELLDFFGKQGKSRGSIETLWNSVHSFYQYNDVPLTDSLPKVFRLTR